jgi:hypothetical protein
LKTKTALRKWLLLAATAVLLITALCIFAMPAAATEPTPPPTPIPTHIQVSATFLGGFPKGTQGTTMDIKVLDQVPDETDLKKGWCVGEALDLQVNGDGTPYSYYPAKLYDYFGRYYDQYLDYEYLPKAVQINPPRYDPIFGNTGEHIINWNAVAYIINHKATGSTWIEVQFAIWYFTDGIVLSTDLNPYNVSLSNVQSMIDAASLPANKHFNPVTDPTYKIRPIICFVDESTQPFFFEYEGHVPSYPTPELPAVVLLGLGLAGIGGFIVSKRRTKAS